MLALTFLKSITYLLSSSSPKEKEVRPATSATSCLSNERAGRTKESTLQVLAPCKKQSEEEVLNSQDAPLDLAHGCELLLLQAAVLDEIRHVLLHLFQTSATRSFSRLTFTIQDLHVNTK